MDINVYLVFLIGFGLLFFTMFTVNIVRFFRYWGSCIHYLSRYNDKILRKLSKYKNKWYQLEELFKKDDKKGMDSIVWLKSKRYISSKKGFPGLVKITNSGLSKLYELYKEEGVNSNKKQEFLTNIAIALIGILFAYSSFQIQAIQTSIMEKSNAPVQATIEVIPDHEDLIIPAWELSKLEDAIKSIEYPEETWARIRLTILNFGKMDSNRLFCKYNYGNKDLHAYLTPNNSFNNIPASSSNNLELHIKYNQCYNTNEEFCDKPELVPTGILNVTLNCECYGCKDQRKFEVAIPICIYQNEESECENFTKTV